MICCLNPDCEKPLNPGLDQRCQSCGESLDLLRNRYKVIKPIGQGGFGKTYLAEDIDNFNELCVVKQLICPTQGKPLQKKRQLFVREARQLKSLNNIPQIPSLLAYFEEKHHPYLVQEFIDGHNLSQELETRGKFTEDQIQDFLLELLPILNIIHDKGIIHRDIKPSNIMRRQLDQRLVLIDFGIAKQDVLSQLLITGTILGTEGFAAVEQFVDGKVCPASDLFSLGVSCFNLLTEISPDHLKNIKGYSWVNDWQSYLSAPIDQTLAKVISKLLEIQLSERYTSAAEVLEDLNGSSFISLLPAPFSAQSFCTVPRPSLEQTLFDPDSNDVDSGNLSVKSLIVDSCLEYKSLSPDKPDLGQHQPVLNSFEERLNPNTPLVMVEIPGGQYLMGSPKSDQQGFGDEGPQHVVNIAPFFMGKCLITQNQWEHIMGYNPSSFNGDILPVEQVSWQEANEFCQRLSHTTGKPYRLPSEAEWEFACRGGTTTPFAFGETLSPSLANYDHNDAYDSGPKGQYQKQTTEVGSFPANRFGLHDMHGNVWEWCQDTWHDSYIGAPTSGIAWEEQVSPTRVLRGGAWIYSPRYCRSASRYYLPFDHKNFYIGFRIAMS